MLLVEYWPTSRLVFYARNPRKNDDAVDQMCAAIKEFGFRIPVVARSDGTVVDGHLRLKAAQRLGLAEVPVALADDLSEAQIKAFRLLANRSAAWAEWDDDLLVLEFADLQEAEFDLGLTGFSGDEISSLLDGGADDAADGDDDGASDEVPEPAADPVVRPGDLWHLGDHRLLCGDSTSPADVARVMAGETAVLCFTSPPYGQQRDYAGGGIGDWDSLMRGVFDALPMAGNGQVLVNLGLVHRDGEWQPYWQSWLDWMRGEGWRRFGLYVWDQGPGLPGDWGGRLSPSFELVFHFNRVGRKPNKTVPCKYAGQDTHLRADGHSTAMRKADGTVGAWTHAGKPTQDFRIADSVIRISRHKARGIEVEHPAVFPVALAAFAMEAYADDGGICFEPFSGSGTAIIAGQQTGRKVRAIQLAPVYADVTLRRWCLLYPDIPPVLDGDGRTYDEIAAERRKGETASC